MLWLRGKPHGEIPWLCEVKGGESGSCKAGAGPSQKSGATSQPVAPKAQRASPSAEQMELGEGWNHVVRGGVSPRPPQLQPPNHNLTPPQQVTKTPEQTKVTATREKARPQKPEPKSTVAPKRAAGKPKK